MFCWQDSMIPWIFANFGVFALDVLTISSMFERFQPKAMDAFRREDWGLGNQLLSRCLFQTFLYIFYFQPYLGKWSNLTHIFQVGWNHQLVVLWVVGTINHFPHKRTRLWREEDTGIVFKFQTETQVSRFSNQPDATLGTLKIWRRS